MVTILSVLAVELPAFAQDGNQKKCYPYCNRYTIDQLKKLDLSSVLPEDPTLYRYRVKGTYAGEVYFTEKVPVYGPGRFEAFKQVGWVNIGKDVTLDGLKGIAHRHFYRIQIGKGRNGKAEYAWIDGQFIQAYGTNY